MLDDRAGGEQRDTTIFIDDKPDQLERLDEEQPHRRIDKSIANAAQALADTATIRILLPPLIYDTQLSFLANLTAQARETAHSTRFRCRSRRCSAPASSSATQRCTAKAWRRGRMSSAPLSPSMR